MILFVPLLLKPLTRREQAGDTVGAEQLTRVSPVAWTHVNCYGRYTFTEEPVTVPIEGFVETMVQYVFPAGATVPETTGE